MSSVVTTTSNVSAVRKFQPTRNTADFFGEEGRKYRGRLLDLAVVKFFCAARLPPAVADYPEWKDLLCIGSPNYMPASRTRLMDDHIMSEQERVRELQIMELKQEHRLTCSFDGGSIRGGDAFYTVHATTPARRVMLLEGQECTKESHTGQWIADYVLSVRFHHPIGMNMKFT
jgi:hypothetical protein